MTKCTNCYDSLILDIMIYVTIPEFVSVHSKYMNNRKGIENYKWYINNNNNLVDIIKVNEKEYKKYNYFKYRNRFESSDLYSVVDKNDGTVEVEYLGDLVVEGKKCHNCGNIMCDHIDSSNYTEYNTNQSIDWICAGLT